MNKFKVITYFQWGNLKLDKGQIILIIPHNPPGNNYAQDASMVSVEHYPEKKQLVSTKAIESMISLQKIERY
jgi:hypothetical protein